MTAIPSGPKREPEADPKKRSDPPAKKQNFRRNKYEVLQSSVGEEVGRVNL
jgi:hypothetical protein